MRDIFFVVPEKYREKKWPDLLSIDKNFSLEELAPRIISGIDCWVVLTGLLLKKYSKLSIKFVDKGISGKICVYHYDNALIRNGVHESYSVVIRADRPPINLSDISIEQNPIIKNTKNVKYIPLWPQPGIIPRDKSRCAVVKKVAYVGNDQYVPEYIKDNQLQNYLRSIGIDFSYMVKGNWINYKEVDVLLAVREIPESVLLTKPASKLVNAWIAGVPIVLGREPAYRALRHSEFDYLEANNSEEVFSSIQKLSTDSQFYCEILKNSEFRRTEYSVEKIVKLWVDFFESINGDVEIYSRCKIFRRKVQYLYNMFQNKIWTLTHGWTD